jgi:integrase
LIDEQVESSDKINICGKRLLDFPRRLVLPTDRERNSSPAGGEEQMSQLPDTERFTVSEEKMEPLSPQQRTVYNNLRVRFAEFLLTQGKNPKKGKGYPENSVPVRLSRFHRVMEYLWNTDGATTELTPDRADAVVEAMQSDDFRRLDGDRYSEGGKRKINNVLENWFDFQHIDWDPDISFSDERASDNADPFTRNELVQLWQASLTYKDIPSYNNLSPDERDRWKAYIAQDLGKPKAEVVPADWEDMHPSWKVPSIIRPTRSNGFRPALINRAKVGWYNEERKTIEIPEGKAPKNDLSWEVELTDEGAMTMEKWFAERENIEKYDGRDEIWLNREGNPYDSGALNDLLDNLMEEAGIDPGNRKLVWYSFRHSVGTYVHDEYKDLEIVAQQLRQVSRESASRYVHPLPKLKREAANVM